MPIDEVEKPVLNATVAGKQYTEIPDDLFIPPDALEILLDSFSGPFDLLLYLIKKQNIDILDIPVVTITRQYLQYIQAMEFRRMELAAEYLVMAAMLAEIKSRFLLPVTSTEADEEGVDPRLELVKRLQAYEQMKKAAELLEELKQQDRDHFKVQLRPDALEPILSEPELKLDELLQAYGQLLIREGHEKEHQISREVYSVKERMALILHRIQLDRFIEFRQLYTLEEGRAGLVVSLLAILELARQSLLTITQAQPFAAIHLKATSDE